MKRQIDSHDEAARAADEEMKELTILLNSGVDANKSSKLPALLGQISDASSTQTFINRVDESGNVIVWAPLL